MSKWIDLSEEEPSHSGDVLIAYYHQSEDGCAYICAIDSWNATMERFSNAKNYPAEVTHWQELTYPDGKKW